MRVLPILVTLVALGAAVAPAAAKALGDPCTDAVDCPVGEFGAAHCTDGVCCWSATCDSECRSCADELKRDGAASTPGYCGVYLGTSKLPAKACTPPTGVHSKCLASNVCEKAAPSDITARCTPKLRPVGTSCAAGVCTGTSWVAKGCAADGKCVDQAPVSCSPFNCGASGCLTTCTTTDECAAGFVCSSGGCVAGVTCVDGGTASLNSTDRVKTPCSPFLCGDDGRCRTSCSMSSECGAGFSCDTTTSKCVPNSGGGTDDGGCSMAGHQGSTVVGLFLMLVAAGLARARRFGP